MTSRLALPGALALALAAAGCAPSNMTREQQAMAREVLFSPADVAVLRAEDDPGRYVVRVDGLIGPLMADDFDRAMTRAERLSGGGAPVRVQLASRGGALNTAIELGERIRAASAETAVLEGEVCFSACTIMWLAGSQKWVHRDGAIGFHEPIPATLDGSVAEARAMVTDYVTSLGYSRAFSDHMMSVPFDEALSLTARDNERFRLGVRLLEE